MQITKLNNYHFLIGREIRTRRKMIGLTQEKLAERTGLSTVYIGRVERGQDTITVSNLILVCDALNTTIYSLFKQIDHPQDTERDRLTLSMERNSISLDEKELNFINKLILFMNSIK